MDVSILDETSRGIPYKVEQSLSRPTNDQRFIVLMTCGIAGSGKTTLSKSITSIHTNFVRLSIDEIIFTNHGLYGTDYPADEELYSQYQLEADAIYIETFKQLLRKRNDIILERSFYAKEDRDEFKSMVEEAGARCVLVYLKTTDKEALWNRICERSKGKKDANSAFEISRERFEMYWDGFEEPNGESEITVEACRGE